MNKILLILLTTLTIGCSSMNKSHIGTGAGAYAGYQTCTQLLDAGIALTSACTLVGGMWGASLFYNSDYDVHTAMFVDTLNTAPGKRSHTNWGNGTSGNWGSITINRTYLSGGKKCRAYESVISITSKWPMNGVHRENEFGTACQMPDGRWVIQ